MQYSNICIQQITNPLFEILIIKGVLDSEILKFGKICIYIKGDIMKVESKPKHEIYLYLLYTIFIYIQTRKDLHTVCFMFCVLTAICHFRSSVEISTCGIALTFKIWGLLEVFGRWIFNLHLESWQKLCITKTVFKLLGILMGFFLLPN